MAMLDGGRLPAQTFGRSGQPVDVAPVMDRHSELDLMCVVPNARGRGIGSTLVEDMEGRLRDRGVRAWFGNATSDLGTTKLRQFYSRHGFTVLDDGVPLPPLLGRPWVRKGVGRTAFYFYKILS
jgi:GNAT superfamily N-acetyltransferase